MSTPSRYAQLLWMSFGAKTTQPLHDAPHGHQVNGSFISSSTLRFWRESGWVTLTDHAAHLTDEGVRARDEH